MKKLILLLCFGMFLISFTSATVSITPPLDTPTNVQANLQSGGTLLANTTYFVRIVAGTGTNNGYYRSFTTYYLRQSAPSIEINFTTNDTYRSANITWDDVPDSTTTTVYLSTTSGNYYLKKCGDAAKTTVQSLDNYYLVSAPCTQAGLNAFSALLLTEDLPFNISKELGNVWINVSGTVTIDNVYSQLVSEGYEDYVFYDGYHFILKGGLHIVTGSASGSMTITKKYLNFFEGGIINNNQNFVLNLGTYDEGASYDGDVIVLNDASYIKLSNINLNSCYLTNSFYVSRIYYSNNFGVQFIPSLYEKDKIINTFFDGIVIGRTISATYPGTNNIVLNTDGGHYPSHTGESFNVKMTDGYIMLYDNPTLNYGLPYFREWTQNIRTDTTYDAHIRVAVVTGVSGQPIKIYDSTYTVNNTVTENNLPIVYFNDLNNRNLEIYNSMNLKITDTSSNPLENVSVVLIDKDGTIRLNTTTYANGTIPKSDVLRAVVNWSGSGTGLTQMNNLLSPFNLTITKTGYADYEMNNFNITDKIDWTLTLLQDSPSFILDKIANIHNFTDNEIIYNITLKTTNKGGIDSLNTILTDTDSTTSPYNLGIVLSNSSTIQTYLKTYSRNSTTYSINLSIANVTGQDEYPNNFSSDSSEINIIIPSSSTGQQLTLTKNAYYNSENSTHVNYTLSIEVVNSGGLDLNTINLIDTDSNLNQIISLNRTQNYSYSNFVLIEKAASNTNKLFVKSSGTANVIVYESNQIQVRIPGYGGPADAIVYVPSSVYTSTDFNTTITIRNMNSDIGQDFTIDYWITNENESINYSSGQQTIYVPILGESNITAILNSPSNTGDYKFKAMVSWVGGTASSYESFSVISPPTYTPPRTTGGSVFTTNAIQEVVCNYPYIRYGLECCLDFNNNSICDNDEIPENKTISKEISVQETEEETIDQYKKPTFNFIKSSFTKVKNLFSKKEVQKSSSVKKNILVFVSIGILLIITIIILLIKRSKKRKRKFEQEQQKNPDETPKELKDISVYNKKGEKIGKIKGAYLNPETSKIDGWAVELEDNIAKSLNLNEKDFFIKQGEYELE